MPKKKKKKGLERTLPVALESPASPVSPREQACNTGAAALR